MKTLKILWLFGLESLKELLFNQLYMITNTLFFLLLLCLKTKSLSKNCWSSGGAKWILGGAKCPPSNTLKKTLAYTPWVALCFFNYFHFLLLLIEIKREDAQRREENLEKAKRIVFTEDPALSTAVKVSNASY